MKATKNAGINAKVKRNLGSGVAIIFAPPPANIRYGLTVFIHNSGHFGPPLPLWLVTPLNLGPDFATKQQESLQKLQPVNSL